MKILESVLVLLKLSLTPDVIWVVTPLVIATLIMLFYFEKYKEEKPGWNTHVGNSLVLLFVGIILLKYIYSLEDGLHSYIIYLDRFLISSGLLLIGVLILSFNFSHFFPEKVARNISSPLTLNLVAFVAVIRVYSNLECSFTTVFASLLIFVVLFLILQIVRIPINKLFMMLRRMKENEEIEDIREEKRQVGKKKRELKKEEKKITREKEKDIKAKRKIANRLNKELREASTKRKKKVVAKKKTSKGAKKVSGKTKKRVAGKK